jgi:hypothetical protein
MAVRIRTLGFDSDEEGGRITAQLAFDRAGGCRTRQLSVYRKIMPCQLMARHAYKRGSVGPMSAAVSPYAGLIVSCVGQVLRCETLHI